MCLSDALADLKADVVAGKSAETAAPIAAAEYGLNPALVLRKFREAYPTDEGCRASHAVTRPDVFFGEKAQKAIDELCRRYGVPKSRLQTVRFLGASYTVIGHLSRNKELAVREDGSVRHLVNRR